MISLLVSNEKVSRSRVRDGDGVWGVFRRKIKLNSKRSYFFFLLYCFKGPLLLGSSLYRAHVTVVVFRCRDGTQIPFLDAF